MRTLKKQTNKNRVIGTENKLVVAIGKIGKGDRGAYFQFQNK